MKIIFRITCVIIYLLFVALIYLSTIDKYDVIYERNPDLRLASLGIYNGYGVVSSGVSVFVILMFQCVFFLLEKSRAWKTAIVIMAILAFFFFFIRA